MPNDHFRFKQFTVRQERCALKVGTDSVLLGAWTDHAAAGKILDIGTGTGVLALIAAQRNPVAAIDAVELDPASAGQAQENAAASPWGARIRVHQADIRQWGGGRYDLILCNPPFYKGHPASGDRRAASARHEGTLDLPALVRAVADHGTDRVRASLILPLHRLREIQEVAAGQGFALSRLCTVRHVARKPAKRVLLELSRPVGARVCPEELVIQGGQGDFTQAYRALLEDLELHF